MKKISTFTLAICLGLASNVLAHDKVVDQRLADEKFKKMDTNSDGMVSRSEFDAQHDEMFKKGDKNNDGSLSQEEFRDAMEEKMEKMKEKKKDIKKDVKKDMEQK